METMPLTIADSTQSEVRLWAEHLAGFGHGAGVGSGRCVEM